MSLRIYNTISRRLEQFTPLRPSRVGIYSCGPTVYRYVHIGNLRTYLMADWLRHALEAQGYQVTHVKNITDVGHMRQEMLERGEDKVIAAALAEGKTPSQIASFYTEAFRSDEAKLNIAPAHVFPHATDHVQEMIDLIKALLEKGFAYERGGNVYFDIDRFPQYGRLSGRRGEALEAGVHVDPDPLKKSQWDFALWKAAEPNRSLKWPSPWGEGFPGWHIECSAMAVKHLGPQIDIHTGGVDNIFPHHEDEIAQSEAALGQQFVRYWVHSQHLLVDGLKMAKATGNTYTLADLENRGFEPLAFRYLCSTVHYRTRMNFTWQALRAAQRALTRLRQRVHQAVSAGGTYDREEADVWRRRFQDAVDDDLNVPLALATAWRLSRSLAPSALVRDLLLEFDRILGLDLARAPEQPDLPAAILSLASGREVKRRHRDYAPADDIRREIVSQGYEVRDGRDGTSVLSQPAWVASADTISASGDVPSLLEEPDALDFSVSVIACDNRPEVERALGSILSRCGDHRVEVIVVDNGSSDDTADWLRGLAGEEPRLRAFWADHNLGAAAARNVALRQARGRVVILLDTSVEVVGDLFPHLSDRLADPDIGIVGRWGVCSHDLRNFAEVDRPGEVDAVEGYFMAFRRQVVRQVGLLDEKFRFYRHLDLHLSLAVRDLGYRLVIDHQLPVVRHEHGEWMRTPPEERERLSKRNFYRFLHKWGERHDLLIDAQHH